MTPTTKQTLLLKANEIIQLNGSYLSMLTEIEKANGMENLSEDQSKSLCDASMKLIQASSKILESCK